jgi:hypothetical protein
MAAKTVAQKMLIRPSARVLILGAPPGYARVLGPLPQGATPLAHATKGIEVLQVFVRSRKELEARLPKLKGYLAASGALWVAYPKGSRRSRVGYQSRRDLEVRAHTRAGARGGDCDR